ncbi:MAG: DEAD/DEAH box helicase, partial [Candidatus Eisenbacteria bacterium]|nr:DEAD/DEAH box helicase [Candidatus Eisenbacteria bacterium]
MTSDDRTQRATDRVVQRGQAVRGGPRVGAPSSSRRDSAPQPAVVRSPSVGDQSPDPHAVLRTLFGFPAFRPHQEEVVRAILDRRDAFVVMPTGGGKSLCYQLPSRILPGTCLVISP